MKKYSISINIRSISGKKNNHHHVIDRCKEMTTVKEAKYLKTKHQNKIN